MHMRLSTLLKIVVACALALGFWRLTGVVGLAVVSAVLMLFVVPLAITRFGRRLGDPILAGIFGGGLGWALWALGFWSVDPAQIPYSMYMYAMAYCVVIGMAFGGSCGTVAYFRPVVPSRRRPRSRRLAHKFDVGLALLLVAMLAAAPIVYEVRSMIRSVATPVKPPVPVLAPLPTTSVQAAVK